MKSRRYHVSVFGRIFPQGVSVDGDGYVYYHDSSRYGEASKEQLSKWCASRYILVRNAALTELADRRVSEWRASS